LSVESVVRKSLRGFCGGICSWGDNNRQRL